MEITQAEDKYTINPEGLPSKVTDYKLFFPEDFKQITGPRLGFVTDRNYRMPSFRIVSGQIRNDIVLLRERRRTIKNLESGIVEVHDGNVFYQTKAILTGETGIGFKVIPRLPVSDFLHTHSASEREDDQRKADLFSAFDLWNMAIDKAERYWLIGQDVVWCLINFYGDRYYHYVKSACWEMAKKYDPEKPYEAMLADLIECAGKCEYRLYKSDNSTDYHLVS